MNFRKTNILIILLVCGLGTPIHAEKQGAALLKTDILCVLAHPDDETGMASTLAYYAHGRHAHITHAYCTRGEGGGNMVGTHWGKSLGILREVELQHCLDAMGIRHHFFLGQLDWAYTESAAMTLEKWGHESTLNELVRLVRSLRPEVILTMNPFPRPGQHGHHQAAGMLAVEAFTAASDPTRFPEHLKAEGLTLWQARKLYFRGEGLGTIAKIDASQPLPDGRNAHEIAGEALRNHRSQGFGRFQRTTIGRPTENFSLIKTVMPTQTNETDLLQGLPLPENEQPGVIDADIPTKTGIEAHFQKRPALQRFETWAKAQNIAHLATALPGDLSVVAGESNTLHLIVQNHSSDTISTTVRIECPKDYQIRGETQNLTLAPHETKLIEIAVTPPTNARTDQLLTARIGSDAIETLLHPVPAARLKPITFTPKLDGSDDAWQTVTALAIAPTDVVQGKANNQADLSAEARCAYDAEFFYVDVNVHDELLVSNIAPNDIRGHWRTDAIELCIDPNADSEHTLTCFKVGIFPFDLTGVTRAARDADAMQGPIEETAPGMRVQAARTPGGYRIQSAIPWSTLHLPSPPPVGHVLSFNAILYDGDKADAAPGENINECRLAWAPRPGVQGRPEDWGRLQID